MSKTDGGPLDPIASDPGAAAPIVACALCGVTAAGPPITWMHEQDHRRGGIWYCERCARENLRSVEAKLDAQWW